VLSAGFPGVEASTMGKRSLVVQSQNFNPFYMSVGALHSARTRGRSVLRFMDTFIVLTAQIGKALSVCDRRTTPSPCRSMGRIMRGADNGKMSNKRPTRPIVIED
jgi:hypothetical protein